MADNVILPSYVCSAPWLAVQRVGAQARIVDIDPVTYNLDPHKVRKARTSRTRAVIVPHLFGLPADLTALQSLGIPLIEDCAQTLGATEQGRAVGSVGLLTVCSFYATKLLCTARAAWCCRTMRPSWSEYGLFGSTIKRRPSMRRRSIAS
jgi:perosamine synthetase